MRRPFGTACATSHAQRGGAAREPAGGFDQRRANDRADVVDRGREAARRGVDDLDAVAALQAQDVRDLVRVAAADLDDAADRLRTLDKESASALAPRSLGTERVLYPFEERPLVDGVAAGVRVLFEQLALAFVELRRNDDVYGDVMVAALRAAHARHAVSAQAKRRSRSAFRAAP